jgi:hypothetical protein
METLGGAGDVQEGFRAKILADSDSASPNLQEKTQKVQKNEEDVLFNSA